uniref:Uncharacterized protein n=1 Tax=Poecilia reticulata TaxID=8081 RepID=A0A3P9QCF8_POERE
MSCDVVSSNQSGVLKHNTLTLGMLYQGGGHGQGRSTTLNFNLYNNTRHEPPAGRVSVCVHDCVSCVSLCCPATDWRPVQVTL